MSNGHSNGHTHLSTCNGQSNGHHRTQTTFPQVRATDNPTDSTGQSTDRTATDIRGGYLFPRCPVPHPQETPTTSPTSNPTPEGTMTMEPPIRVTLDALRDPTPDNIARARHAAQWLFDQADAAVDDPDNTETGWTHARALAANALMSLDLVEAGHPHRALGRLMEHTSRIMAETKETQQ